VSTAIRAIAAVIWRKQREVLSNFNSDEHRSQFYYATNRDCKDDTAKLNEFMAMVRYFQLQKDVVTYLWGQWYCVENGHRVAFCVNLVRAGGADGETAALRVFPMPVLVSELLCARCMACTGR
jgi:hypothetical protein